MRKLRILLATFSILALTAVLLDFTGVSARWFGCLAKIQFLPAALAGSVVVLVLLTIVTLLAGRVYCSVVCPLGILQDFIRWITFGRRRDNKRRCSVSGAPRAVEVDVRSWPSVLRWLRVAILALFVGGGFLGLHFVWLDPYAIYARAAACLAPLVRMGNNELAAWAESHASYCAQTVEVAVPATGFILLAAGMVALIAALAAWRGRVWCNTVCPVGTLLGALAKFAWFRPRIDASTCVGCKLCERTCRTHCINVDAKAFDRTKCVSCFDCSATCPKGAIKWTK